MMAKRLGAALGGLLVAAAMAAVVQAADALVLAHLQTPEAIAKARLFEAIVEGGTDRRVSLEPAAAHELLPGLRAGRFGATLDAAAPANGEGLDDLGKNAFGAGAARTVIRSDVAAHDEGLAELLRLYFVHGSRLESLEALVKDGAVDDTALAAWMRENQSWIDNMLGRCPALANACPAGPGPAGYRAEKTWYEGLGAE